MTISPCSGTQNLWRSSHGYTGAWTTSLPVPIPASQGELFTHTLISRGQYRLSVNLTYICLVWRTLRYLEWTHADTGKMHTPHRKTMAGPASRTHYVLRVTQCTLATFACDWLILLRHQTVPWMSLIASNQIQTVLVLTQAGTSIRQSAIAYCIVKCMGELIWLGPHFINLLWPPRVNHVAHRLHVKAAYDTSSSISTLWV